MIDTFIVEGLRTPIGSFQGQLASVPAPLLGAAVLQALWSRYAPLQPLTSEVIVGCVLSAGLGQAPARQALRAAGLPDAVAAITINKVCGSGLKAVMLGAQAIQCGQTQAVLAGGLESMSQAPFLLPRQLNKFGHQQATDSLLHDGLWDPYQHYAMGVAGELCASTHHFDRQSQDAYAVRSYERAKHAIEHNLFAAELVPVTAGKGKHTQTINQDEEPFKNDLAKLGQLKPAFAAADSGTITAANASKLNDGAAMVWLASQTALNQAGLTPKAKVLGYSTFSHQPEWFTTAPVGAIQQLLAQLSLTVADIAAFEINEAFAVVPLYAQQQLGISDAQLNPRGGAIALGHPIGASGARVLVTLLHTLQPGQVGIACLCIGGGEAVAMAIQAC
jgi:acetyl-CoA C-acetyltransferase